MKRKMWMSLCMAALASVSLTACGQEAGTAQTENTAGTETEKPAEAEEVTLRFSWWGSEDRHEATIKAIERYMELNSEISIEYEYMGFDTYYEKLLTQLSGGTQPDICSVFSGSMPRSDSTASIRSWSGLPPAGRRCPV